MSYGLHGSHGGARLAGGGCAQTEEFETGHAHAFVFLQRWDGLALDGDGDGDGDGNSNGRFLYDRVGIKTSFESDRRGQIWRDLIHLEDVWEDNLFDRLGTDDLLWAGVAVGHGRVDIEERDGAWGARRGGRREGDGEGAAMSGCEARTRAGPARVGGRGGAAPRRVGRERAGQM